MGRLFEKFRHRWVFDVEGAECETCGAGGEEGMSQEEFDKLLCEMDAWAEAEFGHNKENGNGTSHRTD